jgi:hypothetical protein
MKVSNMKNYPKLLSKLLCNYEITDDNRLVENAAKCEITHKSQKICG